MRRRNRIFIFLICGLLHLPAHAQMLRSAEGWGSYAQVGWLFGGKERLYHPNWGTWGSVDTEHGLVFEIFGRFSFTRGNNDINSSNELALLTLGGNWYYRQFRVSTNLLFADTGRDVSGENDGHSIALRLQYLF